MYAFQGRDGLYLSLNKKDKEMVDLEGRIESQIKDHGKDKIILHVQEEVQSGPLEESGFHITSQTKFDGNENKIQYKIFLSRERWRELTATVDQIRGGYFGSRCLYDRVEINYFPV